MNPNYIELTNVTKRYGRNEALSNVSLALTPGKIVGLLGPNGSGKTTLFKTIMRIIRQQQGMIKVLGTEASYETRKHISFMPDREFLYKYMKIADAVAYYQDMFNDFSVARFNELAQLLQLDPTTEIQKLSKGNKEKVILALTLSRNVPIYLLDEPLGSLDPVIKHEMLTVIKGCVTPNNLIIVSTHLIKDLEEILDDVVFIRNGQVAVQCSRESIIQTGKSVEQYYLEVFTNV
jgi:ABC-2 type transport system ATP-binding protein